MALTAQQAYILSKKYTADTAEQFGAVKGAPCTIASITHQDGINTVIFEWENDQGVTQQSTMIVQDGTPIYVWESGNTYHFGDLVIYASAFYRCIRENSDVEFDDTKWNEIGSPDGNYDIVQDSSLLPPRFTSADRKLYYSIEDEAFFLWNGTAWVCQRTLSQYSSMPTASAALLDRVVQYLGTTAGSYTQGYFYVCKDVGEGGAHSYVWQQLNVQSHITVDSAFSDVSENPVQNKVITEAVNNLVEDVNGLSQDKQPKTLDTPITIDGTEETTVEGALSALNNKTVDVDDALSNVSENPVQNKVITAAIDNFESTFVGTQQQWNALTPAAQAAYDLVMIQDDVVNAETIVDVVADGNMHPVTSNAVYDAIQQGGGGGTSDYTHLTNKPTVNGVTLTGDMVSSDLQLADASHTHTMSAITDLPDISAVIDDVATNTSAITSITQQLSALVDDVGTNTSAISTINTQLSALIDDVGTNTSAISTINQQLSTIIDNVGTNTSAISTINHQLSTIIDDVSTNTSAISSINHQLSAVIDDVSTNTSAINTINLDLAARANIKTIGSGLNLDSSGELTATGGSGGTTDYADLTNKPSINNVTLSGNKTSADLGFGTASALNVASSGDASTTEVVKGNDTRLTDSRNAADVYSWAKEATKPSYTASEVGAIASTEKGANSGVAELDTNGKVPSAQLPSYVDDVVEYASTSAFPATGESGKIYIALDTNKTYRWGGSEYVEISESLALGETASTAYAGNKGKANADAISAIKDGQTIDSFGDVETALSGKADKVSGATNGNFAGLDANGNLTDSGVADSGLVHKAGAESISGLKTFNDEIVTKSSGIVPINLVGGSSATETWAKFTKGTDNSTLGLIGVKADNKPYFYDSSAKRLALLEETVTKVTSPPSPASSGSIIHYEGEETPSLKPGCSYRLYGDSSPVQLQRWANTEDPSIKVYTPYGEAITSSTKLLDEFGTPYPNSSVSSSSTGIEYEYQFEGGIPTLGTATADSTIIRYGRWINADFISDISALGEVSDGHGNVLNEMFWKGTTTQWTNLSASEKAKYDGKAVIFTDDAGDYTGMPQPYSFTITGTGSSVTTTFNHASITADMRVIEAIAETPSAVLSDISITTANGSMTVTATVNGSSVVKVLMQPCKAEIALT